MNKVKFESIKTISILLLVVFSINLWLEYSELHNTFRSEIESQINHLHVKPVQDFRATYSLIEKIESKNFSEALYYLYLSAKYDFDNITKNELKKTQNMELFPSRYKRFMQQACMSNIIPACVNYGDVLVQVKEYDSAFSIYEKAANAQDLNGVSRLVDLFYIKAWDRYSEETAKKYLLQLGK